MRLARVCRWVPQPQSVLNNDATDPQWGSMPGEDFSHRIAHAQGVQQAFDNAMIHDVEQADAEAQSWLASTDQTAFAGSRHHVVPRFLLERWANERDQARGLDRIESRFGTRKQSS